MPTVPFTFPVGMGKRFGGVFDIRGDRMRVFKPGEDRAGGDVVLAKSHRGLHLLARAEPRLRVSLEVLRNAYGSALVVEPIAERAPVVAVRIGLERVHLPAVRAALRRRGANPAEEYRGIHYCVLRFEAGAADLLGLPAELAELTRGRFTEELLVNGRLEAS
jgi:hypothetical protein